VTQDDLALSITGLRPGETPFLQPLGTDPESASVPDEDFSRLRWPLQNKNRCPLRGSHDKRSRTAYARSRMPTRRSNVLVSKSGCTSIRRPPGSTTASPQLGSCCIGAAANSTGTNRPAEEVGLRLLFQRRFFRWRTRVLKLKPRLWQNSLRRIPLLTNSATNC